MMQRTSKRAAERALPASACSLYGPTGAPVLPSSTYHPLAMVQTLTSSRLRQTLDHGLKLKVPCQRILMRRLRTVV